MTYSSVILADNPQAYYRMNESSGSIAHDSTSNHYDASLSGGFTLAQPGAIIGSPDTSILFNGLTDNLSLPYQLNYTTFSAISIEFWIKLASSWQYIVMTCDDTTTLIYDNTILISASPTASIEISNIFDFIGSSSNAYLAQFALYNYVLSSVKMQVHFNNAVHFALFPAATRRTGLFSTAKRRTAVFSGATRRTGIFTRVTRRTGTFPPTTRRQTV